MGDTLDCLFQALADPTRRRILALLEDGEASTGDIAGGFTLSRPAISKHLGVLVDAELVLRRKEGRKQMYSLQAPALEDAYAWLARYRRYWEGSLSNLKRHVEENP